VEFILALIMMCFAAIACGFCIVRKLKVSAIVALYTVIALLTANVVNIQPILTDTQTVISTIATTVITSFTVAMFIMLGGRIGEEVVSQKKRSGSHAISSSQTNS